MLQWKNNNISWHINLFGLFALRVNDQSPIHRKIVMIP